MKRIIALISLPLIFVLIGCDTGSSQDDTPPTGPIVCFGDSLTEGYGAGGLGAVDRSRSYPAFLQRKVAPEVVNAGISGDTAADGLVRVERDVLSRNPQMVIIFLGANDFLQRRPAAETKADLQAIINRIRDGERKIFLVSFLGDLNWEANLTNSLAGVIFTQHGDLLSEYRRMFDELVSENNGLGFIPDIWTGVWGINMSDPIHPNAAGYEIIAETIFNAIRPNL